MAKYVEFHEFILQIFFIQILNYLQLRHEQGAEHFQLDLL